VGIIDSQSAKTAKNGGPRGYDASRKVKGRKRHIATDTLDRVVAAVVHPPTFRIVTAHRCRRPENTHGSLGFAI